MGACAFSDIVITKGTVSNAYREAVEEARDYNGHQDGYSGDIQTTYGYREITDFPRFGTKKFDEWEEKRIDNMDKCDCEYIELTGAALKKLKDRSRFKGKKGVKAFYFFGLARC